MEDGLHRTLTFIVFNPELLISPGIEIRRSKGGSFDQVANDWHRDLVLSGKKLFALVDAMLRHGESGTLLKKRLQELVETGIRNGELPEKLRKLLG